jgi:hypothetical protein
MRYIHRRNGFRLSLKFYRFSAVLPCAHGAIYIPLHHETEKTQREQLNPQ